MGLGYFKITANFHFMCSNLGKLKSWNHDSDQLTHLDLLYITSLFHYRSFLSNMFKILFCKSTVSFEWQHIFKLSYGNKLSLVTFFISEQLLSC